MFKFVKTFHGVKFLIVTAHHIYMFFGLTPDVSRKFLRELNGKWKIA